MPRPKRVLSGKFMQILYLVWRRASDNELPFSILGVWNQGESDLRFYNFRFISISDFWSTLSFFLFFLKLFCWINNNSGYNFHERNKTAILSERFYRFIRKTCFIQNCLVLLEVILPFFLFYLRLFRFREELPHLFITRNSCR